MGHAHQLPETLPVSWMEAQDKLAPGAGMEGQPRPASERAAHLHSVSWMAGDGQAKGTRPSPRSLSLVVSQTFKIVYFTAD